MEAQADNNTMPRWRALGKRLGTVREGAMETRQKQPFAMTEDKLRRISEKYLSVCRGERSRHG